MGATCTKNGLFGNQGEEFGRSILRRTGYFVLPGWNQSRGAPLLRSLAQNIIAPDIIAAINKCTVLVDVKAKRHPTKYNKKRQLETGCGLRHYKAYIAAGENTGLRVALLFLHAFAADGITADPCAWFGYLDEIGVYAREFTGEDAIKHFGEDMIFFCCDPNKDTNKFKLMNEGIDALDDAEWLKFQAVSQPPKIIRPWEKRRKKDFPGQGRLF
jgi:hypothetical protein